MACDYNVLLPELLLERFPLEITALDADRDRLFLGTSDGSLLTCGEVELPPGPDGAPGRLGLQARRGARVTPRSLSAARLNAHAARAARAWHPAAPTRELSRPAARPSRCSRQALVTRRNFSRRPIDQFAVVRELQHLLILSDGRATASPSLRWCRR